MDSSYPQEGLEEVEGEAAGVDGETPEADANEILDRVVDRVKIKGGIDINQLKENGAVFEIDEDAVAATNEEYKEEFEAAQRTSYGQVAGKERTFLGELGYDGLGGYGLGIDDENDSDPDGPLMEPFESLAAKMSNLTDDGGVKKKVVRPGGGIEVMEGAEVHVHYNGYLEHHDEPFDSTRLRNKKQVVQLGHGNLIPGLEIGIKSMKQGEISRFLIEYDYAYGDMGCPPRVPAKSTVLFEVELIHFHDEAKIVEFDNLPMEEMSKFSRVFPAAEERWKEGKAQYVAGRHRAALKTFKLAATDLEKCNLENEEEEKNQQTLLFTLFKNLAVVAMKLKDYHKTIKYGTKALGCPKHIQTANDRAKCNYLCGKANRLIGELRMSKMYLEKAYRFKPNDKMIAEELDSLDKAIDRQKVEERLMAQRMILPEEEHQPLPNAETCPWLKDPHTMTMCLKQLESFFEDDENDLFKVPKDRINSAKEILMWEEAARRLDLVVIEKPSEENRRMRVGRRTE